MLCLLKRKRLLALEMRYNIRLSVLANLMIMIMLFLN